MRSALPMLLVMAGLFGLAETPRAARAGALTQHQDGELSGARRESNVSTDGLALQGHDPVAYFEDGRAHRGDAAFSTEHDGITYRFCTAEHQRAFEREPRRYVPAYGGWCATGMAFELVSKERPSGKYPVDPETFKISDGRLYLFFNEPGYNALSDWNANEAALKELADRKWAELSGAKSADRSEVWGCLEALEVTWMERSFDARRGTLQVPADRANEDDGEVELEFLWVRSPAPDPGPPILYLQGGPGLPTIDYAPYMAPLLVTLLDIGDLILFDQRGSGRSRPNLKCGHAVHMPLDEPVDRAGVARAISARLEACRAHFAADGVDLSDYDTRENADDVAAVCEALGLERVRLFGSSYGSHLALAVIARHPDLVDAAILEAVSLPDGIVKLPSDYESVLRDLEGQVAETALAERLEVGLRAALSRCLEQARSEPYVVRVTDPETGRDVDLPIGPFDLVNVVIDGLISREFAQRLPALVARLDAGDASDWAALVIEHRRWSPWTLAYFAIRAASGLSDERHEQILAEAPATTLGHALETTCWASRGALRIDDPGPEFRRLPESEVPILAFSGRLDPQTPPRAVERLRVGMPGLVHVVIEDAFHSDPFILLSPRVGELVRAFLSGERLSDETIAGPPLQFEAF